MHDDSRDLLSLFERLYKPLRLAGCSYTGLRHHRETISQFARFLGKTPTLDHFDDVTVAGFLDWVSDGRSASTANSYIDRLLAQWRFYNRRGLISRWPEVRQLNVPERIPLAWLREEMARLWVACEAQTGTISGVEAAGWWLGIHCCIADSAERVGAILRLEWRDIDLDNRWITIRAESRKGKTRDRMHQLHVTTVAVLARIKVPTRKLVFPWEGCSTGIWHQYESVLKAAGLPIDRRSKFHRMRRTVASYFAAAGGDPTKLLDHSDPRVTKAYLDLRIVQTPQASDLVWRPPMK